MANNPYVNKVQFGNQTVIDISDTDAQEGDVVEGKTFYKGTGQRSTGTGNYYSPNDTAETAIADNDYFPFYDTSAMAKKKTLWSNIKAKLKTYFDGIYSTFSGSYDDLSDKPGVVSTSANGLAPKVTNTSNFLKGDGTWATPTNTKNTAGSTDTSSKIFLIGATSQAANPQTYSDNEVFAQNGVLTSKKTTTKAFTPMTGTGTAGQDKGSSVSPRYFPAKWTFNSGITVSDGEIYFIKIPVAGHAAGVWVSLNNGTNYYPVAVSNGKNMLTTHYPATAVVAIAYESAGICNCYNISGADAKADVTGCFRVLDSYDSNTTYSAMSINELIAGTATSQRTVRADYLKSGINSLFDTRAASNLLVELPYADYQQLTQQQQEDPSKIYWCPDAPDSDDVIFPRYEQRILGAKNLLPLTIGSQTINGVTWTVNSDGSVTANGTATGQTNSVFSLSGYLPNNSQGCIFSGVNGGSSGTYFGGIMYSSTGTSYTTEIDSSNGDTVIPNAFDSYPYMKGFLAVTPGTTVSNLTFYPMLRLASDPDNTFAPYAMTNRELTDFENKGIVIYPTYTDANNDVTISGCTIIKKGNIAQIVLSLVSKRDIAIGSTITLNPGNNVVKPLLNTAILGFSGSSFLDGLIYASNGSINIRVIGYVWYNAYGVTLTGTFIAN